MKSFTPLVLCGLMLSAATFQAHAQQVYRCGNSYSQTPCAGAVTVQTDDARTDQQRAEARQALASDKALAKELEARRHKEEAAAAAETRARARSVSAQKKQDVKSAEVTTVWQRTDVPHTVKRKTATRSTRADTVVKSKKKSQAEPGKP